MSRIYKALQKAEAERVAGEKSSKSSLNPDIENDNFLQMPAEFEQPVYDKNLVSLFQPGSLASEQFRKLRTFIRGLEISSSVKTIMVTSAVSDEGKSFVAANMAIGMAHDLDHHALLVDCDLRNPTQANNFAIFDSGGISDYLVGNDDISKYLINTSTEKLTILVSGKIPENPSELIGSTKMKALVSELKSRYKDRFIIFDTTPVLATSEAEILAKLVDGIIFVVRAGKTPRETIMQAIETLGKEKILGIVLNHVEFKTSGLYSRYFGADGYYYSYGHDKNVKRDSLWEKIILLTKKISRKS